MSTWNDENKKHALDQLKYLLTDWISTNKPQTNISNDIFKMTCKCILDSVIIPRYEYKDGIEYIEWNLQDHEMINSCIDKYIPKDIVKDDDNKDINKDINKDSDNKYKYMLYIIIFILVCIILLFLFNFYWKSSNNLIDITNLNYD